MNPILSKAREQLLAKVRPQLLPVVQKLVNAGHQVMWKPQTQHLMMNQLKGAATDQMDEVIGAGIAKLVGILYAESKKTAPPQALVPAGMVLLMDGLDFLEEAGAVKVTPQFLSDCTQAAGSAIAQIFGATPERLAQLQQQHAAGAAQPPGAVPPAPAPTGIVGGAMQPEGGA